MAGTLALVG